MVEKRETIHQMLRRCFNWDYKRPGSYIVTLTLADRSRDWLGRLVTDEQARPHEGARERGWAIELSPLGEIVARCWRDLATNWPGVEPREFQVMPEHFHGILRVTTPQKHPLGQIIGSFKAKATAAARELAERETLGQARAHGEAPLVPTSRETLGQARAHGEAPLVPTSRETLGQARAHGEAPLVPTSLLAGNGLFSPGLQDTILWDLKRYRAERDYLLANPARLAIKRAHPELFKVARDLAIDLAPRVPTSSLGGLTAHFSAIGNHFLLQKPLFQVQCSRRDFAYRRAPKAVGRGLEIARASNGEPTVDFSTPAFEARRDAALLEAARGSVLISPCVSDGERQIAREALEAGFPLITLQNKGFAPLQKPSGRYFDACAAGRLLMLAPAAWPHVPGHKPMTRDDATAMNRLCQWLAGDSAATINYHGLLPADIDARAKAAALALEPTKYIKALVK